MTISEYIKALSNASTVRVEIHYAHPTLYVLCISDTFVGVPQELRTEMLRREVELPAVGPTNPLVEIALLTEEERAQDFGFLDGASAGTSWLSAFSPLPVKQTVNEVSDAAIEAEEAQSVVLPKKPKAIHFYGYKGGQGRSTVLMAFAKTLADSGFTVLAVDADIEAPSLDSMLGVSAADEASSLMGMANPTARLAPLARAYVGTSMQGVVDLVPARPVNARFDMDFAAFLMNASLDAEVLRGAVGRMRQQVEASNGSDQHAYDVVLFDHRTGLAPSVLPIMEAWPGPAVIFVRPDGMAQHIQDSRLLDELLSHDPVSPGAFVSFSLDPKMSAHEVRHQHARFIEGLLSKIGDAMQVDADLEPDLEPYWLFWRHDQSLLNGATVTPTNISGDNRETIADLRSILGFSGRPRGEVRSKILTSSGSSDEGQFILTPGLAKVFSAESAYTYIFGRKGTGKTRLLTELVRQQLAEPLLVANDAREGGLPSGGAAFEYALSACDGNFQAFWWLLLRAALSVESTRHGDALETAIRQQVGLAAVGKHSLVPSDPRSLLSGVAQRKRVFVIDGVETAVPAASLRAFVESLFRFLAVVQYDRTLASAMTIRLLLRTDLATGATQNVEQQIEGLAIYLHWNKTTILNFALARIASLDWFRTNFSDVCNRIDEREEPISRGALPDEQSEELLLEIFPWGLERNRLKATTFFATYFSDAGGDAGNDSAFYPRLFDGFLRTLAKDCAESSSGNIVDGRLSSLSVLQAYDHASRSFIDDVRTELYSFLNLESGIDNNKAAVDRLISAFNGLATPFSVEQMISVLSGKTKIKEDLVRLAISSMQKIGMFESRIGYPGELRARQLYKAGLGMKYVRKRAEAN
ncbi:hypothetical protein LMG28727_07200 [Paraburkholderia kirstenboschensis]|uniref:P-loop NTPase n=1 Tax=Paraburkholderia kirstenboschensis TaxID=1245436 RepID=UPI000AC9718D|nr:P-loop NTPase [Paraburkholderia kirstenboschensis]CAD6560605.1 hypothetical protein LMG28727_07200 [Paraburkholderia kirstenboschensis]